MKKTNITEKQKRIDEANKKIMDLANCNNQFLSSLDCGFSYFYLNQNTNRLYLKYFGKTDYNKKDFYMSLAFKKSKLDKTNITQKEKDILLYLSTFIKFERLKISEDWIYEKIKS